MAKEQTENEKNLEVELLKQKLKNLEQLLVQPKNAQEEYQERVAKYEAEQGKRDKMKKEIEKNRMELWAQNPRARQDEIVVLEAWIRKAATTTDPEYKARLEQAIKAKFKEINTAYDR